MSRSVLSSPRSRHEAPPQMSASVTTTAPRLDQMFAAQASATPNAAAVIHRGAVTSYGDLQQQVERLSAALARHGVGPGVLVAISLERTPDLIAVLLAILDAGGAYLPLDARYPPERTAFVLSDSGAAVLLTDRASPSLGAFGGTMLELVGGSLVQRSYVRPARATLPPGLGYVIYTSGSTGAPKGVMLGHGATHLVDWARQAYSDEQRSRVAATTALSFDPSVFEVFVPLCTGGAVVLKDSALEPFAADERPSMLDTVPSVLAELCRAGAIPDSVQVLNVGGEVLRGELVSEVYRRQGGLLLFNHYGPTEATTCATVATLTRGTTADPPIGRPVRGAEVVLLDPQGRVAAEGEVGEIHIGGPGLALGYLGQPELTASRFIDGPTGRQYRTGDLGVWRDGQLHFAGRRDGQVKVRGVRIELGEIEAALLRIPGVERALSVVREAQDGRQVIAYLQSSTISEDAAREALAAWLPSFMLPSRVLVLDVLPTLASGKIDRNALPALDGPPSGPAPDLSRLERPVIHVFQEVLCRQAIGPSDSFFDLGGDSLASVRAALRLEEVLGYEIPAALIHQAPSPRALARALAHAEVGAKAHISLLQPGGSGPPLFCLADLFGQAFNYLSLARRLAPDRAIYGVAPGPMQAQFTRDGDVAALTTSFVAELRRIQPHGPYCIAGYSAGGLLAVDLASALERAGEEVRLVLLDAYRHAAPPAPAAIARWAWLRARRLFRREAPPAPRPGLLRRLGRRLSRSAAGPAWLPRSQVAFAASMIKAGAAYHPPPFFGPTLLISARDQSALDQFFAQDGLAGWSNVVRGPVAQAGVSGDHHQFLREPMVGETARLVGDFLVRHESPDHQPGPRLTRPAPVSTM
jgi:amino acid adenylation domain-containing protein